MAEHFAFYSQTHDALPEGPMRALVEDAALSLTEENGQRVFCYQWEDLSITFHEMADDEVPEHLVGFQGYVTHLYRGDPDQRGEQILDRIRATQLVVGTTIEPGRDEAGRVENLLGAVAQQLGALVFFDNALFDTSARLILAPDGSFDEEADVTGLLAP